MINFPDNPEEGTIYQLEDDLYFTYKTSTNSWVKIPSPQQLTKATPLKNGLMSKEDYTLLHNAILPLLETTLKGEGCTYKFIGGNLQLVGNDNFVTIKTDRELINSDNTNYEFKINKHTNGIDFTINEKNLINYLIEQGQLDITGPKGYKGPRGEKGDKGDSLPTGEKGDKGPKGDNPPYDLTFLNDPQQNELVLNEPRAITRIDIEDIDEINKKMVFYRSIIGKDIATTKVNTECVSSTWLVAVERQYQNQQGYIVDIGPILNAIKTKYESELEKIRTSHEQIVGSWLETLKALFERSKETLCCLITICKRATAPSATTNSFMPQAMNIPVEEEFTQTQKAPQVLETCSLSTIELEQYFNAYNTKNCNAIITNIAGQNFAIIQSNQFNDCSISIGDNNEQPTLAWPVFDDDELIALFGNSPITFKYDKSLNDIVVSNIKNNLFRVVNIYNSIELTELFKITIFPII